MRPLTILKDYQKCGMKWDWNKCTMAMEFERQWASGCGSTKRHSQIIQPLTSVPYSNAVILLGQQFGSMPGNHLMASCLEECPQTLEWCLMQGHSKCMEIRKFSNYQNTAPKYARRREFYGYKFVEPLLANSHPHLVVGCMASISLKKVFELRGIHPLNIQSFTAVEFINEWGI